MNKKIVASALAMSLVAIFGFGIFTINSYAEEGDETSESAPATSISIMPVSRTLQIESSTDYDGTLTVTNDGDADIKIKAYAAPYSYVRSEGDDTYRLGFSNETGYTQISRWISIKDADGNYVKEPVFTIKAHESLELNYKISTPLFIPL